jgi:MFS family permease
MSTAPRRWYHELNRYHWFVLIVAALGWLFDTMDQQLFNLARQPAMEELLAPSPGVRPDPQLIRTYGGYTTSIFMIGWATGGIAFGVLGDRYGRAKTMLLTILLYSLCTGLSAFSVGVWDFAFYRFLTGLGVGGEFAVGVALVAEVMPNRARPFALGLLQALSAVGNMTAALIGMGLGELEQSGIVGRLPMFGFQLSAWRLMFVVGTLPALLAIIIRRRLKEPEQWKALVAAKNAGGKQLGSYRELLGTPELRRRAIVGLIMACAGVIGVWGIGFFSPELIRSVFTQQYREEARAAGEDQRDREFVNLVVAHPEAMSRAIKTVNSIDLVNADSAKADAAAIYDRLSAAHAKSEAVTRESLLDSLGTTPEERNRLETYLDLTIPTDPAEIDRLIDEHVKRIADRSREHRGNLTWLSSATLLVQNFGAFFGIYMFSVVTHYTGRRWAFAAAFLAAMLSTILVFSSFNDVTDFYWMVPLMGFCQMSVFGGYAIYFPELFPTRLRSTGTSFCYNVGRFFSSLGPIFFAWLQTDVFGDYAEPLRPAAIAMSAIYLLGIAALPFAPETKDRPLPE